MNAAARPDAWDDAARRGDWPAAWAINDAVLAARDPATRDDPAQPYHLRWVWDGRPFDDRAVLVRCYHGLGDTLHFARYLGPLAARARHVTVEAPAALVPLLRSIPAITVHAFDVARPLPPQDCDIESMELAHALRIPPGARAAACLATGPVPRRPGAIGLSWRGGDWNTARSVPFAALGPLLGRGAGRLWSLQLGEGGPTFHNPDGCGPDLAATARLLASLDLVVTIDSMIAHLAGALGRPAIVLLPARADWRWGDAPERCSLYPCHTLIRQRQPGSWNDVVARAAAALTLQGTAPDPPGGVPV